MTAAEARVFKARIRQGRDKAEERAGHSRPSPEHWFPTVTWLLNLGYTKSQVNAGYGWTADGSYLRKILRVGSVDGTASVAIQQGPKARSKIPAEYLPMLEETADAFELFYNRFYDVRKPLPAHCKAWVAEALESKRLLLNVPPRHNKSTTFSIWWVVWNLVRDRNLQFLIVSLTSTLAVQWAAYIATALESPGIAQTFGAFKPDKKDGTTPWIPSQGRLMVSGRTKDVSNSGGPQFSVLARGSGQQILGFEADYIVIDDVTSRAIARSEAQRKQQIEWLSEDVMTRLQPTGKAIMIGQRVHLYDCYSYFADQEYTRGPRKGEPIWRHLVTPAVLEWPDEEAGTPGRVLWPEVWSFDELMESYASVGGDAAFTTMYQQDPQLADATLVRDDWVEACKDMHRRGGEGYRPEEDETGEYLPIVRVISLDPSPTRFNGLICADVVYSRDRFVCAIIEAKHFKGALRQQAHEVERMIGLYNPDYFIYETNSVKHWLQGDPWVESLRGRVIILPHDTHRNKGDAELGLESLSWDFESASIRLPCGDPEGRASTEALVREARNWTREGRLEDDILMALWFIKWNYKRLVPRRNLVTTFTGKKQVEWTHRADMRKRRDPILDWRKRLA